MVFKSIDANLFGDYSATLAAISRHGKSQEATQEDNVQSMTYQEMKDLFARAAAVATELVDNHQHPANYYLEHRHACGLNYREIIHELKIAVTPEFYQAYKIYCGMSHLFEIPNGAIRDDVIVLGGILMAYGFGKCLIDLDYRANFLDSKKDAALLFEIVTAITRLACAPFSYGAPTKPNQMLSVFQWCLAEVDTLRKNCFMQ